MSHTKRIVIGFHSTTLPRRHPAAYVALVDTFRESGVEMIAWYTDGSPPCGTAFRFAEEAILQEDEQNHGLEPADLSKWVSRISCRSGMTTTEAEKRAVRLASYSRRVFMALDPDCFIGWNNLESTFGIASDVARRLGIPILGIEHGPLPASIRLDYANHATRIRFDSLEDERLLQFGERLLSVTSPETLSLYEQTDQDPLVASIQTARSSERKVILVLGTMESDTGQVPIWHEEKELVLPGFSSTSEIASFLAEQTNHIVLYKPHPFWKGAFPGHQHVNSRVIIVNSNPLNLIKNADIVVSALTKLEVPVVLFGKPLITVGIGFFGGLPVGVQVSGRESLIEAVNNVEQRHDPARQLELLKRSIGFLYKEKWLLLPHAGRSNSAEAMTMKEFVKRIAEWAKCPSTLGRRDAMDAMTEVQNKTIQSLMGRRPSLKQAFVTLVDPLAWKRALQSRLWRISGN